MQQSVTAVENILRYTFNNKKLLEEALTHSSFADEVSYERLEFVGDAVLSLAVSNHLFLAYPNTDPGKLSLLRSVNVSTEKLARVAVRLGLHRFVRHSAHPLVRKVAQFVQLISQEDRKNLSYGGTVKAPKVLADVFESIVGAIYIDLNFDLQQLWLVIRGILEPIVTLEDLEKQPQPVTLLHEVCQRNGIRVDIKNKREGDKTIATVYVDGKVVATASSDQRDIARLEAAKIALDKISPSLPVNWTFNVTTGADGAFEIEGAKHKLHEFCGMKKWPKPVYIMEKDEGPSHARAFVVAVQVEAPCGRLQTTGDEKSRLKDAENSAASYLIRALQQHNYL